MIHLRSHFKTYPQGQLSSIQFHNLLNVILSGILAASIDRSRQKWLVDGVFEKYWTKPTKKKGQPEVQNPARSSMRAIGGCQIIIEPHVFEATLYTVMELQHTVIAFKGSTVQPFPSHTAVPYGSPYSAVDPPQYHHIGPMDLAPQPQPHMQKRHHQLPPFKEGFARFEPQGPLPPIPPFGSSRSAIAPPPPPPPPLQKDRSKSPVQDSSLNADPIIQMLAARAAEDENLKSLMRIVADGEATQKQLKAFQAQIDELTEIIATQNIQTSLTEYPIVKKQEDLGRPSIPYDHPPHVPQPTIHQPPAPPKHRSVAKYEEPAYHSHSLQAPKYSAQISQQQDVQAIALEFQGGNGDRYLFPRYSILEYLPGNTQALASFLVTRTGATAYSDSYQANTNYYQPVTIRLRIGGHQSHNQRVFDVLPKAVAPPEEVRKHMNEIMDKMKPAELVHLVTQLPRTHEGTVTNVQEASKGPTHETLRRTYSPPNSLLPLRPAANP